MDGQGRVYGACGRGGNYEVVMWSKGSGCVGLGAVDRIVRMWFGSAGNALVVTTGREILVSRDAGQLEVVGSAEEEHVREAVDVNERGDVVGYATRRPGSPRRGVLWRRDGEKVELGRLSKGVGRQYVPYGINDAGTIVGWVGSSEPSRTRPGKAWIWTEEEGMHLLEDVVIWDEERGSLGVAEQINNAGWIAGRMQDAEGRARLFVARPVAR